jgi:hypothetical protein
VIRKIDVRLADGNKWERAIGKITKEYLHKMVARSVLYVRSRKKLAPRLSEVAEAIEFPTQQQVINRWNRVKKKVRVKNPAIWTPRDIPNFSEYRQAIIDRENERWFADLLFGLKKEAYLDELAKTAIKTASEPWIDPRVIERIRTKTIKVVTTDITQTLRDKLTAKLEQTINAGFTIDETAHDLGFLNTNWRTIAKTETFDVLNQGAFDQVKAEAGEVGAEALKYWQHSGNPNGRESHVIAGTTYNEANAIPIDEPFIVDGEAMMYPHDPNASAKNVVNCGCNAVYIIKN